MSLRASASAVSISLHRQRHFGDAPAETGSGIVSFFHPGKDFSALNQKLAEANIITSLRTDRAGQNYIRLSPHFYNTDEELNRVLEMV